MSEMETQSIEDQSALHMEQPVSLQEEETKTLHAPQQPAPGEEMKKKAESLHIYDRCIFAGNKSNASEYYQAMDYFCFPSRYEGLPGSVIEAQASGLQCLISDTITSDVNVTELVSMRSINSEPRDWARKILDDLMLHEDYQPDALAEEMRLNKTVSAITGQAQAVTETPDMHRAIEYSIGDRSQSSEYILRKLQDAGFDVKAQAVLMGQFYEKGHF